MNEEALRSELCDFYWTGDIERAKSFAEKCYKILDSKCREGMTVLDEKLLQYDVISEEFTPVLFRHTPIFFESGALCSLSDGAKHSRYGFAHAAAWTYERHDHLLREQSKELWQLMHAQKDADLYLICGQYNDTSQHFNFNYRPILQKGLKGVYEKARSELPKAKNEEERAFLEGVCRGMLALKRMAEKFAKSAKDALLNEKDEECVKNLTLIADTAKRVPWEAPSTLYEALTTLAFLRTAVGTLEGVGPNTFGRLDVDLIGFYRNDIASGRLTKEQAYELICQFLIIWDCHYDHDMPMEGYADHELENTYTLGGCDSEGAPVCNEITLEFLRAQREKKIIFPKIKCRFGANSPKEYLDAINESIIKGSTVVLLQNDDATIPALIRGGRTVTEARDYYVSGCWGVVTNCEKYDHGSYLNMLKPFEMALHNQYEKMASVGLELEGFDSADSFEELYRRVVANCEKLLCAKLDVEKRGGNIFHKVDRFPIFSSTLGDCIENHADFTMGGGRYRDDYQLIFGLPNIVDSLMAIKTLVFDKKKYGYKEFLEAVRAGWEGHEDMRLDAVKCHGWGDGNEDSCAMAARFNSDLFEMCQRHTGAYGGRVHMGHLTYTEIRWWGERTLATPDGRKNGEYFSQGLTPSRLKRIPCVFDVINSLSCLDGSMMAASNVVNIILPQNISLDRCEGFLRAVARSATHALQLNCTSKEQLLDAQAHPENYPDLVVRVTGFSAKFTSLSKGWQDEVISRNFYD